jgi:hypothetical protein
MKERLRNYIEAIEEIKRLERQVANRDDDDALGIALLGSAIDAAHAAWLLLPPEFRETFEPPPKRQDL